MNQQLARLSQLTLFFCLFMGWIVSDRATGQEPLVLDLWPGTPPGETESLPPEADMTKPEDKLIAGRRIIKLGNVSVPQIAVYRPAKPDANQAAVIVCPGGGHYILAYDLEGTEVAKWLNGIGVTAIVLKYRVPARNKDQRWMAAVQDAQRAVSMVRKHAKQWNVDPERIGICGFSAGGETAALASIFSDRQYDKVDDVDQLDSRPDFAMLVYPGGLVDKGETELQEHVKVDGDAPPFFFAHAFDDPVTVHNTFAFAAACKEADVPAELHVYPTGGHGYGLRRTNEPVTGWPDHASDWMRRSGFLGSASSK